MSRWPWLALLGLVAAFWWFADDRAPLAATTVSGGPMACPPPPSFVDAALPRQSEVAGGLQPFRLGEATVSPLAGISLQARVLSREDYSLGAEADYSPTDLALGWGPMSAPGLADKLDVSQAGRWYRYRWGGEGPPLAPDLIARNSANMHMVPANGTVARALAGVESGDMVRIDGWLVRIDRDGGWHWQSSLSRDDSGAGACELVYVCSIEVH